MNTRKLRKAIMTLCAALLLVSLSVGITVAYLTDTDVVDNTFTVGKVGMTLNEAKVNEGGHPIKPGQVKNDEGELVDGWVDADLKDAPRVESNTYKLYPGHVYTKDPTIVMDADSDLAFLRVVVTFEGGAAAESIGLPMASIFTKETVADWTGEQDTIWGWNDVEDDGTPAWNIQKEIVGADVVYTLTANDFVDHATPPIELFDTMTVPDWVKNEQLNLLQNVVMNIKAYAVQADGFDGATTLEKANKAFATAWPELWGAK